MNNNQNQPRNENREERRGNEQTQQDQQLRNPGTQQGQKETTQSPNRDSDRERQTTPNTQR